MIDEVKQTDQTQNLTQDAPEEIARDKAEMDFQAEAGLFSEEAAVDENSQADVEAEADTSLREEMEAEIAALEQEVETQKAQWTIAQTNICGLRLILKTSASGRRKKRKSWNCR